SSRSADRSAGETTGRAQSDRDHRAGDRPEDDMSRRRLGREEPVEEVTSGADRSDPLLDRGEPDGQRGQGHRDRPGAEDEPPAPLADDMPEPDAGRFSHVNLPEIPDSSATGG